MSKRKGMSLEEKRQVLLGIYHTTVRPTHPPTLTHPRLRLTSSTLTSPTHPPTHPPLPTRAQKDVFNLKEIKSTSTHQPTHPPTLPTHLFIRAQKDVFNLKEIESLGSKQGVVSQR